MLATLGHQPATTWRADAPRQSLAFVARSAGLIRVRAGRSQTCAMSTRTMARRVIRRAYARGRLLGPSLDRRARSAGLTRVRPAVLMYHRVGSARVDQWGLTVSPERFDEQLSWLSQHRLVLPLTESAGLQAA